MCVKTIRFVACLLWVLPVLALTIPAAGAQSIAFDPEMPTAADEIEITVAAILGPCTLGIRSVEIGDGVISITVGQACVCVLAPPPYLQSFATTVGPLSPGTYRVDFFTAFVGCDQPPPPDLQASATLVVEPAPYEITVEPAAPTTADEVTLTVRSQCPALFAEAERDGVLVRLTQLPDELGAPCFIEPVYETHFDLGTLEAGEYAALLLFDDPLGPPSLNLTAGFAVVRAPARELLLRAGRFRVSAEWTVPDGGSGLAWALPLSDESGALWFFDEANLELLVKVLDGCSLNGAFWVFAAGLTDVGVVLTVEDTLTGVRRIYSNPQGTAFEPILDIGAFACP